MGETTEVAYESVFDLMAEGGGGRRRRGPNPGSGPPGQIGAGGAPPPPRRHAPRRSRRGTRSNRRVLKNLVVLMRFSDHKNRPLPTTSDISALMNHPGGNIKQAPTGSIRFHLDKNSYGTFRLESTILPWITLPYSEARYAAGTSGLSPMMHVAIRDALDIVNRTLNVQFDEYDVYENGGAGDGVIDAISFFHSGYPAEYTNKPDCYGQNSNNRIWSHEWSLYDPWFWNKNRRQNTTVIFYPINSALWGKCGTEITRIGVMLHEIIHFLGGPDLYDTVPTAEGYSGFGVGNFGLMGNSWGEDYTQLYPRSLSPWVKFLFGWLKSPALITQPGRYTLQHSRDNDEVYIIKAGFATNDEYLLLEHMDEIGHTPTGMIVWHIDNGVRNFDDPRSKDKVYNWYEGHPFQPDYPESGRHYRVALAQADGEYDLEQGYNEGDAYDVLSQCYVDELGPSQSFKGGPHPNTDAYNGGNMKRTGVYIHSVTKLGTRKTRGPITFQVDFGRTYADTQRKLGKVLLPEFAKLMPTTREHYTINGCQFHVLPKRPVTLLGFDVHVDYGDDDPPRTAEIWRLPTNLWSNENSRFARPSDWTKLGQFNVKGRGPNCRTPIDLPSGIELGGNQLIAFYITFPAKGTMIHLAPTPSNQGRDLTKAILAEDEYVRLMYGIGMEHRFGGYIPATKVNVAVRYASGFGGLPPTPAPVSPPTMPPFDSGKKTSIATKFDGTNNAAGVMFNVRTKRDVEFRTISIHPANAGGRNAVVYFRRNGYAGAENSQGSGWVRWCSGTVSSAGAGREVKVDNCSNLWTEAGTTMGFYVSLPGVSDLRNTDGFPEGVKVAENGDAIVYSGVGKGPNFGTNHRGRVPNVRLGYGHSQTFVPLEQRSGTERNLVTQYTGVNQASGCTFAIRVEPNRELRLNTFGVHTDDVHPVRIEVYHKTGTLQSCAQNRFAWGEPVCKVTMNGAGRGRETKIPIQNCIPKLLTGGSSHSFYMTFESVNAGSRRMKMKYTDNGGTTNAIARSNADMKLFVGCGKGEVFDDSYSDRVCNTRVYYTAF